MNSELSVCSELSAAWNVDCKSLIILFTDLKTTPVPPICFPTTCFSDFICITFSLLLPPCRVFHGTSHYSFNYFHLIPFFPNEENQKKKTDFLTFMHSSVLNLYCVPSAIRVVEHTSVDKTGRVLNLWILHSNKETLGK